MKPTSAVPIFSLYTVLPTPPFGFVVKASPAYLPWGKKGVPKRLPENGHARLFTVQVIAVNWQVVLWC